MMNKPRPSSTARRATVTCVFMAIAGLAPRGALAQVNVETLRRDLQERPQFFIGTADMAARAGNVQRMVAGASGFAGMLRGRHLLFSKAYASYGSFGGTPTVSYAWVHTRYNYRFLPFVAGELFAQGRSDRFRRLRLRDLYGIGPRFDIVDSKDFDLAVGTAYMFEHEIISVAENAPDLESTIAHRSSNYVAIAMALTESTRVTAAAYLQPRWDAPADFRFFSDNQITVNVTDVVALAAILSVRYDSRPPTDVVPTDVEIKNAFELQF